MKADRGSPAGAAVLGRNYPLLSSEINIPASMCSYHRNIINVMIARSSPPLGRKWGHDWMFVSDQSNNYL